MIAVLQGFLPWIVFFYIQRLCQVKKNLICSPENRPDTQSRSLVALLEAYPALLIPAPA
jgi:hypothetical protein